MAHAEHVWPDSSWEPQGSGLSPAHSSRTVCHSSSLLDAAAEEAAGPQSALSSPRSATTASPQSSHAVREGCGPQCLEPLADWCSPVQHARRGGHDVPLLVGMPVVEHAAQLVAADTEPDSTLSTDCPTTPKPLSAVLEAQAQPLFPLFGERLTRCIYSEAPRVRDAALRELAEDFRSGAHKDIELDQLMDSAATVLAHTFSDEDSQVFLSSAALLQAACDRLLARIPATQPGGPTAFKQASEEHPAGACSARRGRTLKPGRHFSFSA